MSDISSIGFALDPTNVPSFLLDWELTKRCNLDCSYCFTGIDGGHDNSMEHPSLDKCLETIDFMFSYVDKYVEYKRPSQRKVVLNVYGGESLFHPNIVEILEACREKYAPYKDRWYLTLHCTTNAVVGARQWDKISGLIDNFTISYHPEATPKQKEMVKRNALMLKANNIPSRIVTLMHNKQEYWEDCMNAMNFFKEHGIESTAKPLDNHGEATWGYDNKQIGTFKTIWLNSVTSSQRKDYETRISGVGEDREKVSTINEGRSCCGNRKLSINGELKSCVGFVPKQGFNGWYCSVNWFFLFIQQVTGDIYTNKDCKVNLKGEVGPIGNMSNYQGILDELEQQLTSKSLPVIQCIKAQCKCGFCAPKAELKSDFDDLMTRHIIDNPLKIN
jgi:pyruvate-formate lyase-activating enzyme